MFTTSASPEMVLHAGQVYDLPRAVAKKLLDGRMVHGIGSDGKPKLGGPCCEIVHEPGVKAQRVPVLPDPEDRPEMEVDDNDFLDPDESDPSDTEEE